MTQLKYRIYWYIKVDKTRNGHGDWFEASEYDTLKDWITVSNKKYPEIEHIIENNVSEE